MSPPTAVQSKGVPGPTDVDIDKHEAADRETPCGQPANLKLLAPRQEQQRLVSDDLFDAVTCENVDPLFDFEPLPLPESSRNQGLPSSTPSQITNAWDNFQPPSPPNSAVYSSEDWPPFGYGGQVPHNILTQIDPSRTRTQYGQTTPPGDEIPSKLEDQSDRQLNGLPSPEYSTSVGGKKRKQSSTTNNGSSAPPKRVRKNISRLTKGSEQLDPNNLDDVRRSKFLERNRVAASKCRQKKKEWTQGLEHRSRELQRKNQSIRMLLDSCKEEILFLKGEMLKHSACGCVEIQEYLQRGATSFVDQDDKEAKQQPSSTVAMSPTSPADSGALPCDGQDLEHSPKVNPIADDEAEDDRALEESLEALLRPQYTHDTSDEGIAAQVRA